MTRERQDVGHVADPPRASAHLDTTDTLPSPLFHTRGKILASMTLTDHWRVRGAEYFATYVLCPSRFVRSSSPDDRPALVQCPPTRAGAGQNSACSVQGNRSANHAYIPVRALVGSSGMPTQERPLTNSPEQNPHSQPEQRDGCEHGNSITHRTGRCNDHA